MKAKKESKAANRRTATRKTQLVLDVLKFRAVEVEIEISNSIAGRLMTSNACLATRLCRSSKTAR